MELSYCNQYGKQQHFGYKKNNLLSNILHALGYEQLQDSPTYI